MAADEKRKKKSGACKQGKKGERELSNGCCFDFYAAALHFGSGACKAADPSPARGVQPKV